MGVTARGQYLEVAVLGPQHAHVGGARPDVQHREHRAFGHARALLHRRRDRLRHGAHRRGQPLSRRDQQGDTNRAPVRGVSQHQHINSLAAQRVSCLPYRTAEHSRDRALYR